MSFIPRCHSHFQRQSQQRTIAKKVEYAAGVYNKGTSKLSQKQQQQQQEALGTTIAQAAVAVVSLLRHFRYKDAPRGGRDMLSRRSPRVNRRGLWRDSLDGNWRVLKGRLIPGGQSGKCPSGSRKSFLTAPTRLVGTSSSDSHCGSSRRRSSLVGNIDSCRDRRKCVADDVGGSVVPLSSHSSPIVVLSFLCVCLLRD